MFMLMATVSALDIQTIRQKFNVELKKMANNMYGMGCGFCRGRIVMLTSVLNILDCPDHLTQDQVDGIVSQFRNVGVNDELLSGANTSAVLSGSSAPVLAKPQIKSRNISFARGADGLISSIDYGTVQKTITRDANSSIIQMKVITG